MKFRKVFKNFLVDRWYQLSQKISCIYWLNKNPYLIFFKVKKWSKNGSLVKKKHILLVFAALPGNFSNYHHYNILKFLNLFWFCYFFPVWIFPKFFVPKVDVLLTSSHIFLFMIVHVDICFDYQQTKKKRTTINEVPTSSFEIFGIRYFANCIFSCHILKKNVGLKTSKEYISIISVAFFFLSQFFFFFYILSLGSGFRTKVSQVLDPSLELFIAIF